jgi:SpoVK/Ycf46/Vps4 family AAA+-type ATPase
VLSFDCSKILSMYVGESEKNVRKIFDTYYDLTAKTKTQPILLLNEADQFLSSRSGGIGSSADQMHNQMQNIFLEQIERFEGILVATTNLLENIDSAFSRRFNYKIEFKKPNEPQRKALWALMLPENAPYEEGFEPEALAKYALTGGQINLVIKNTAYAVATREEAIFRMKDFIAEIEKERLGNFDSDKAMGFLNG